MFMLKIYFNENFQLRIINFPQAINKPVNMALSIDGHVIWDPKWDTEKKIGIALSGAAAFSILVVVLTFVSIITIETKQKMSANNETTLTTPSPSNIGKYTIY